MLTEENLRNFKTLYIYDEQFGIIITAILARLYSIK